MITVFFVFSMGFWDIWWTLDMFSEDLFQAIGWYHHVAPRLHREICERYLGPCLTSR